MASDAQGPTVVGVDVGGTNIEAGLVGADHDVRERAKEATPTGGPDEVIETIDRLVASLDGEPVAVGVGIPGVVLDGRVMTVPNLKGWHEQVALRDELTSRLGLPVSLGNDANVGVLGEWVAGSARGARNVLGVWMGTGVGGGLILDGRPFVGVGGGAGEFGHMVVRPGGAMCGCGRRGCVEAYAGRRQMAATVTTLIAAGRTTALFEIMEAEGKSRLTSKVWAAALDQGDEVATEVFGVAIEHVGIGVASAINLLDLDLVVFGGGLAEKLGQDLADRIMTAARPWMLQPSSDLRFVAASLGDDAGVVGAATLARAEVISD